MGSAERELKLLVSVLVGFFLVMTMMTVGPRVVVGLLEGVTGVSDTSSAPGPPQTSAQSPPAASVPASVPPTTATTLPAPTTTVQAPPDPAYQDGFWLDNLMTDFLNWTTTWGFWIILGLATLFLLAAGGERLWERLGVWNKLDALEERSNVKHREREKERAALVAAEIEAKAKESEIMAAARAEVTEIHQIWHLDENGESTL